MMGKKPNGNTCSFLDIENEDRSPHGGFLCKIYQDRPLACRAYPMIETKPILLDAKCKFCKEHGSSTENLNQELESLSTIQNFMKTDNPFVWRYATGIGEDNDKDEIEKGWFLES